jgi:diguanylate cyclase (GGDEF)-like protein/PAS domain S-box-containing protein
VSPSVTDVLGWAPEDLVGRSPLEFAHPDDLPSGRSPEEMLTGEEVRTARHRMRGTAGSYRWFETTMRPVHDADGRFVGRVGRVRDIEAEVRAETELARTAQDYRLLVENGSDVVFRASTSNILERVSPRVQDLLGWRPTDMVGLAASDFVHPEDVSVMLAAAARVNAGEDGSYEARFRTADGGVRWLSATARPLLDSTGQVVGRVGSWRDVEAEVTARAALVASESMFRASMESAAIGMAMAGMDRRFLVTNPALRSMLGYDDAWFLEHTLADVVHPDDVAATRADGARLVLGETDTMVSELRLLRADGAIIWVRRVGVLIRDAHQEPSMLLLQVEDITAERDAREALAYQAFHDPLTGLRNRAWILDILEVDLASAKRHGSAVGALFVDLDNFKVVNDSLGHLAGDEVLATVANRIASALRAGDRVGRFGGDEFVIVVPDVAHTQELELVAHRVSSAISVDLVVQGHRIVPTASIGIAVSTSTSTGESLLRDTDSALFRAKAAGRAQWQFFDAAMHAQAVERLTVEDQLRDAIARHEFLVHYQPIVDLADATVVGHEALVRWNHPVRGLLSPADFLDVAEDSSLITEIGAQVLDQVCALLEARPDLPGAISVNVSAVELTQPRWLTAFRDTLARHHVRPDRIVVEVTETAVLSLLEPTRQGLVELRDLGIGIHVDDFGTGFSSISVLRDLPVTGLKLDRRFVSDLTASSSPANALARGLSGLVAGLGLEGVAEGIETPAQAAMLREQGWQRGQGYYFGRPEAEPVLVSRPGAD